MKAKKFHFGSKNKYFPYDEHRRLQYGIRPQMAFLSPTMEVHTTCTICNRSYSSSARSPPVLPCSHFFCQDCLQQLEAAGDRRCTVCRVTWSVVGVADVLSCYQLIPADGRTVKAAIQGATPEVSPQQESVSKKCWRQDHKNCEIMLLEEKCEALNDLYSSRLVSLTGEQSQFELYQSKNFKDLMTVNVLQKKLLALVEDLTEYGKKIGSCQSEVNKVDANNTSQEKTIQGLCDNLTALGKLETQMTQRPPSLLLRIADAYQRSGEDAETFISNLKSILDTSGEPGDPSTPRPSLAEALEDGNLRTIEDWPSAAVRNVLHAADRRPKLVEITYTDRPEHTRLEMIPIRGANNIWQAEVKVELECFLQFGRPSTVTIVSTSARLDDLLSPPGWASLSQFWGHLDAVDVQKLPATIKSVGLVLREKQDMAAVNALCGTAYEISAETDDRKRLKWPCWTHLDLSVATTFEPDWWRLSWEWAMISNGPMDAPPTKVAFCIALDRLGIHLRLHLPQLVSKDMDWLEEIISNINLFNLRASSHVTLFLPGASIDPKSLLGWLRDVSADCEVHLPASLPQPVPREETIKLFNRGGHSVTWDLK